MNKQILNKFNEYKYFYILTYIYCYISHCDYLTDNYTMIERDTTARNVYKFIVKFKQ